MASHVHARKAAAALNRHFVPVMPLLVVLSAITLDRHPVGWLFSSLLLGVCVLKMAEIAKRN